MDVLIRMDISRGIEPVPVFTDMVEDIYIAFVDGIRYEWPRNTFPIVLTKDHCADKALILKHAPHD